MNSHNILYSNLTSQMQFASVSKNNFRWAPKVKGVYMNYRQFVNEVEMKVQKCVEDTIRVQEHIALKNNGKERRGLTMIQEGINISPTIYLEEYYEQFQDGNSLEQIVERILNLYKEVRFRKSWEGSYIQSFESVKPWVVYKVINKEKNKELLKETPYMQFLDLAVVCYVLLEMNSHGTATMLVKEEHLKMWGVSKEEVFCQAEKNSKRLLPAELNRMKDVIAEILEIETEEDEEEDIMYVLSNARRNFGAICMVYDGIMDMIQMELGENFYVIPSSVHEVIIVPESQAPEKFEIEEMVAEINATQVEDEEILSDRVYYYSVKEKKLI